MAIKIALAHQTHANLTFVNAEAMTNAVNKAIHVRRANANAVKTRNANLQTNVFLGNVLVCNFQSPLKIVIVCIRYLLVCICM